MLIALTHLPSPKMAECELTYVARAVIDHGRIMEQHEGYCQMLRRCGAEVRTLEVNLEYPDCTFIEDTAIVLDELAVLMSMGAASRRAELAGIEPELRKYRDVQRIELPATIDGGDVLCIGRTLLVGLSSRTNSLGVNGLKAIVCRHGYRVIPVQLRDCLHLKSACTALPDGRLLVNPEWLVCDSLKEFGLVPIPKEEPWAADILLLGQTVCVAVEHPQTASLISGLGVAVETTALSEFAKAEGGVTCLSLLVEAV
jgi:dimethylargininase